MSRTALLPPTKPHLKQLLKLSPFLLIKLNPLYAVIANFRNAVFGKPLDLFFVWFSLGFGALSLLIGVLVFYRKQDKFILHI